MSLQSGCNKTLDAMNRRYKTEEFEKGTQLLSEEYPNACLTTDIIVGFPGETKEDFEITYNFLKKINFYKMHVFKYSPRKGTKAAEMDNQVDGNIKEERSERLLRLSDNNEKEYLKQYIGKTAEVLFEQEENGYIKGHMANYIEVKVKKTEEDLENKMKKVLIKEVKGLNLVGEPV